MKYSPRCGLLQPLVEAPRKGGAMDKLRALQYCMAAADGASFSAAARELGVSTAAVAKLIAALERQLGIALFERHAGGLALTAGGEAYLDACRPAYAQLLDADEQASATLSRLRGTVVVGVQPVIAQECLTPALPRFFALHPEIQLDVRYFMRVTEEQTRGVDVFLIMGWPQAGDLVQRHIGATSFVVCASPAYWALHGMPRHPSELEHHNCLCIRGNFGTVMDLWRFRRGDECVSVAARGQLVVDNAHRDMVRDLAVGGIGVARLLDWHKRQGREIASGALVPALTDWAMDEEVPPVNLLYPPSVRRIPRVRAFIDFATTLFRDIEMQRSHRAPATTVPAWATARRRRASATAGGAPRERAGPMAR
jgi:DNA-binding transcriptional LysR family regulator